MNSLKIYAVIHKSVDAAFWVAAPDMPGCFACGATIAEAVASFREALALHIEGMRADKVPLPAPRSREDILHMQDDEPVDIVAIEIAI